jgi:hypothetical protein
MKFNENPLMVVLGFLILLLGIGSFFGLRLYPIHNSLTIGSLVLDVNWFVYLIAGVIVLLVFLGNIKESVGMIIFAFWLALIGVISMSNIDFTYRDLIMSLMPIGAGGFLILGL